MRNVELDTISDAFMATFSGDADPRFRVVLTSLVRHMHAFAKETSLTHEEWHRGLSFLMATGAKTDEHRNEFVLMSDVLGLSSVVDLLHSPRGATPSSVLGPFHITGAPVLPYGGDLKGECAGPAVIVMGMVRNRAGQPLADVDLEIWQTAPNGLYSNQDAAMDPMALRARLRTRADGSYLFSTVRPAPYTVPTDGPVGDILKGMGRHPWRPAHFHFIAQKPGYRSLVTEVFPSDDPYLDSDAVFGVREGLIMPLLRHDDKGALPAHLAIAHAVELPFFTVQFDVVLASDESSA